MLGEGEFEGHAVGRMDNRVWPQAGDEISDSSCRFLGSSRFGGTQWGR